MRTRVEVHAIGLVFSDGQRPERGATIVVDLSPRTAAIGERRGAWTVLEKMPDAPKVEAVSQVVQPVGKHKGKRR